MILGSNPTRACIYFIYDRDGIVDDYVIDQLKDIRSSVNFIHCVINGKLTEQGKCALEQVSDEVYVRENKGNDIGAYKAGIDYIGWEKLAEFDELVLMNNTCFGPVYPFKESFDWAKTQDIDFWALTWDTKSDWLGTKEYLHYNESKLHYQSYFLVFRKPLLGSQLLKDFFNEIPNDVSYILSGCVYEYAFPGYFEERGYKGAVYCDCDDYHYPLLHNPVRLFKEFRMPLFKKRNFFHHYTDVMYNTAGESTVQLIRYLENETDYNMDRIWDSILRINSLSDIVRCAQLNRILPRNEIVNSVNHNLKVGLVYHAYYQDQFDEDLAYVNNFPQDSGILITTNSEDKKNVLEEKLLALGRKAEVLVVENRGRDVSSLLVGAAEFVSNYDLVCFGHDKKSDHTNPPTVGRSWAYRLNENTYGTKEYVANIINLFASEKRLGIAFPPAPNHNIFIHLGSGWSGNFENTKTVLDLFDIHVKIDPRTLCVAPLGTCFWFRPEALKKLFAGPAGTGWSYDDFPSEPNRLDQTILHAIERAYAYVAQDAGYYPVYLYNDKYAEIEFTNLEFHKSGSADMRYWMDAMVMSSIGQNSAVQAENYIHPHNYGIKESLRHLSFALYCRFPRFWTITKPLRSLAKKFYRLTKKLIRR